MNSKEAVGTMREINNRFNNAVEIELKLISYNDYTENATSRKVIYKKRISKLKKEAKEIYKMFNGGCKRMYVDISASKNPTQCGGKKKGFYCSYCKEIKNIHDALHVEGEEQ